MSASQSHVARVICGALAALAITTAVLLQVNSSYNRENTANKIFRIFFIHATNLLHATNIFFSFFLQITPMLRWQQRIYSHYYILKVAVVVALAISAFS